MIHHGFYGRAQTVLVESELGPLREMSWEEVRLAEWARTAVPPSCPDDPHDWHLLTTVGTLSKDMVAAWRCQRCSTVLRPVRVREDVRNHSGTLQALFSDLRSTHAETVPDCSHQALLNLAREVMET